mmetsp:Transcript_27091/g.51318  ORF Transcript_27091/g.51318 Transcript_27091/m.51318 type:complete len:209 (-) Transcript_27091:1801-2427(-)
MLRESLPPSIPTPRLTRASLRATQASHIFAPSPASLAAYIQLPDALISSMAEIFAHMMLVRDSATTMRAMAAALTRPLMGCSPTATTVPVVPKWEWATTPLFARGICSGPTQGCWAMRPVTDLSTLWTRNLLEPTARLRRTLSRAVATVASLGKTKGLNASPGIWESVKVLGGRSPRTSSSGRSTGVVPLEESLTTTFPSPVTSPRIL